MVGSVFLANFGRRNWAWESCRDGANIAVMDDAAVHEYWLKGDRDGYMAAAVAYLKSATGDTVAKGAATRWWNHNRILHETAGDLWLHQDAEFLWWTISGTGPTTDEKRENPFPEHGTQSIYLTRKPCQPWSNRDHKGDKIHWDALHPCAQDLLSSESTFVQPNPENRAFIKALLAGDDLAPWTDSAAWRGKLMRRKRKPATTFDDRKRTFADLAMQAMDTCKRSGLEHSSIYKYKEFRFPDYYALEKHIDDLFELQDGFCALTDLPMLFNGDPGNPQLRCSLDRIDSSGHYEPGNLQLVCRFANRWKGAYDDAKFRELIGIVRAGAGEAVPL